MISEPPPPKRHPDGWILRAEEAADWEAVRARIEHRMRRVTRGSLRGPDLDDAVAEATALAWQLGELSFIMCDRVCRKHRDFRSRRKEVPMTDIPELTAVVDKIGVTRRGCLVVPLPETSRLEPDAGLATVDIEDDIHAAALWVRRLGDRALAGRIERWVRSPWLARLWSVDYVKRMRHTLRVALEKIRPEIFRRGAVVNGGKDES